MGFGPDAALLSRYWPRCVCVCTCACVHQIVWHRIRVTTCISIGDYLVGDLYLVGIKMIFFCYRVLILCGIINIYIISD